MLRGIDRCRTFADLEMQLRRSDAARLSRFGNHLPALYGLAAVHKDLRVVGVGRHPAVSMLDQYEVAVTLQLVAGIGDDPILRGLHGGVLRHRDVDTV